MAIFYVDYENGNDANDGLSFANRKKTIPSANSAAIAGDTIRVMASLDPTSIGSATWNSLSKTITLASALTKNISLCESSWTAAANVTATTSTTRKEGSNSSSIAIAAAFTTGQVARESFTATDFSAYKQVSFWIRTNAAIAASTLELRLCSDSAGTTTVVTIPIPAIPNLNVWTAITYDTGGALGASIQSVVLHATADPGTVTILLDNIIACKDSTSADAITLNSLLGKNTGTETWWAIQSINGTTVLLDQGPNDLATTGRGYSGSTETVTTYKRRPIQTDLSTATSVFVMTKSGSVGSPITVSGGWNRTDMTTQTGLSFFTGRNGSIEGLRTAGFGYLTFEKIGFFRYTSGWQLNSGQNLTLTNCTGNNNNSFGIIMTAVLSDVSSSNLYANGSSGLSLAGHNNYFIDILGASNASQTIITSGSIQNRFKNITASNNGGRGFYTSLSWGLVIENLITSDNASEGFRNDYSDAYLINPSLSETIKINMSVGAFSKAMTKVKALDGDANDNRTIYDIGTVKSVADSDRHTASGWAWKFSPTSANASSDYPLSIVLARVACASGNLVTIKCWVKRSNTGLTAKLVAKGGQISGVPSDVVATASAGAGTYEELSLTFTPSESGVIEIEGQVYGGTTLNAWFDDMTITQL